MDIITFTNYIKNKNNNWINDINNSLATHNQNVTESKIPYSIHLNFLNLINKKIKNNFQHNKDFFMRQTIVPSDTEISNIKRINDNFYDEIQKIKFTPSEKLSEEDALIIQESYRKLIENSQLYKEKLNSFYSLKYSIMDKLKDPKTIILMSLKALNIFFTFLALFLTTRIFIPMYENAVYNNRKDPPGLWKYLMIFLALDIAFNTFVLITLSLVSYIYKNNTNTFPIDKDFFYKFIFDYLIRVLLLYIISNIIGHMIIDKKYFKYKYEGQRAIRAFEKVILKMSVVIYMIPYFLIIF